MAYDYLFNTDEGLGLMSDHQIGLNNPDGSGDLLTISTDTKAVESTNEQLTKMNDDSSGVTSLDANYILSRTRGDYKRDAVAEYNKEVEELANKKGLTVSERKLAEDRLNNKWRNSGDFKVINEVDPKRQELFNSYKKRYEDLISGADTRSTHTGSMNKAIRELGEE